MSLESLKVELNKMKSNGKINDYFLKRISLEKYELKTYHYINGKEYFVLINFNYDFFIVDNEIKKLKELMTKNYIDYLNID